MSIEIFEPYQRNICIDSNPFPGSHLPERDDCCGITFDSCGPTFTLGVVNVAGNILKLSPKVGAKVLADAIHMKKTHYDGNFNPMLGRQASEWGLRSDRQNSTVDVEFKFGWEDMGRPIMSGFRIAQPQLKYLDYSNCENIGSIPDPDERHMIATFAYSLYCQQVCKDFGFEKIEDVFNLWLNSRTNGKAVCRKLTEYEGKVFQFLQRSKSVKDAIHHVIDNMSLRYLVQMATKEASDHISSFLFANGVPYAGTNEKKYIVVNPETQKNMPPLNASIGTSPLRRLEDLLTQMNLVEFLENGRGFFNARELSFLLQYRGSLGDLEGKIARKLTAVRRDEEYEIV